MLDSPTLGSLTTMEEELASFLDGDVPPDVVGEFFEAAAALYRAAPWKIVTEDQVVRIDIARLGIDGHCLSVIGSAGESLGLLLFPSLDDFDDFIGGGGKGLLSLSFGPKKMLAPSMIDEIREYEWRVAAPRAYPSTLSLDAKRETLRVTERDYEVLTAENGQRLQLFTAPPGTPTTDALRLLGVLGHDDFPPSQVGQGTATR